MNGLINTSKLGNLGGFGSLLVALFSVSAVVYVMFASAVIA